MFSNSNSSCKLLDCLNSFPRDYQRHFRNLFSYRELVRLSVCCRSLRSSIRDDPELWQKLYQRDFLSGTYYAKEMDFVLWCIRTDVNNPCTSEKRADLLAKVDWYNVYRRRVSTENNWRFGRCNTTHIDMEFEKSESICNTESGKHSIFILATQQTQYADTTTSRHYYGLELSAHSNLGQADDIVQNSSLSTSSNMIFLDSDNGELCYFIPGDQYIVTCHGAIDSNADLNITILSRQYGNVLNMFSIPRSQRLKAVEGNWILLEMRSVDVINGSKVFQTNSLMMFDIDNEVMCPGELNEVWHVVCFYKTTERAAIVYTARLVKEDTDRIEWALYRFSNNKSVKRLRSGWFQLPEIQTTTLILVYKSCDSQMIIELYSQFGHSSHVIHSVASGGQGSTPRNCIPIFDRYLPAPLLRAGFNYLMLGGLPVNVWTDADYNDDQILQIPGAMLGINVIGDLYLITAKESSVRSWYLVDINTKEVIRELDIPNPEMHIETYAMVGTISNLLENNKRIIQEYGAL